MVVINGHPGVGKDSFVDFCKECAPGQIVESISSVDRVKEAAEILGWGGLKDDYGRSFLSELKDLSTQYYDGPLVYIMSAYNLQHSVATQHSKRLVFFVMIREPEEIKVLKSTVTRRCGEITTVLIKREHVAELYSNHADKNVAEFDYDMTVYNSGSIEDLKVTASRFMTELLTVETQHHPV